MEFEFTCLKCGCHFKAKFFVSEGKKLIWCPACNYEVINQYTDLPNTE